MPHDDPIEVAESAEQGRVPLDRLITESDSAQTSSLRALWMYERGVATEADDDDAAAAASYLNAINSEPEFGEPLEHLIAITEQRQSHKNLARLLERLVEIAREPEPLCRALTLQALHLSDHEAAHSAALEALRNAVAASPDDGAALLALEIVAARAGDAQARRGALEARAASCDDAYWRSLLLIDLARLEAEAGDPEQALRSLDRAVQPGSRATFTALQAMETIALAARDRTRRAEALRSQAALIARAIADPEGGDALGVPASVRTQAHLADALLRGADLFTRTGNPQAAAAMLDEALGRGSDTVELLRARGRLADALGEADTAADVARRQLAAGVSGPPAASLWLRAAEAAAASEDGDRALEAVEAALREDPGSLAARALYIDLLSGSQEASKLANALEACAEHMETDAAKARVFVASADAWARLARETGGAKAALSQASMFGLSPGVTARLARMLSIFAEDQLWYEEATRRLLASGSSGSEQASLWFEIVRARLLRSEMDLVHQGLDGMRRVPQGSWLAAALQAGALPFAKSDAGAAGGRASLLELSAAETDAGRARALQLLAAARAIVDGEIDGAIGVLQDLHGADAADVVSATALAVLLSERGRAREAADVLGACAATCDDPELCGALQLQAGIRYWRSGDRARAIDAFTTASVHTPESANAIACWALRAAEPDDPAARRQALDAAGEGAEPAALALERFALELGPGGDLGAARAALDSVSPLAHPDLAAAASLARAVFEQDAVIRSTALTTLSEYGGEASRIANVGLHQVELDQLALGLSDPERVAEAARRRASSDGSSASAIEWLAASHHAGDGAQEIAAYQALSDRIPEAARPSIDASAALLTHLNGDRPGLVSPGSIEGALMNLELAAPGGPPERRAHALAGSGRALGDEADPLGKTLAGYNHLAAGQLDQALAAFRASVEAYPLEVIGWEGLRAAAEAAGDLQTTAEACAALGDALNDDARAAEQWERAAFILLDRLADPVRGEFALARAVARDIRRPQAYDRLFRLVRARRDGPRLLELIRARLEVAEEPAEIVKLFWERARVLRESGDREGALAALENVTLLEPDHVGALALSGEIYITSGQFEEAASRLSRLAMLEEAPTKQRLMSGVAAVDLYENKLGDVRSALRVLSELHESGLSTLPVRERLARAAAKAGDYPRACAVLELLMRERPSREGRLDAARLAMVIHRDRLGQPAAAAAATEALLAEAPADPEALDLVLSRVFPDALTTRLLEQGKSALVATLERDPLDAERVERLARIASRLQAPRLRQATLGTLVALGHGTPQIEQELSVLDERVSRLPRMAIDEATLPDLCDPEDAGPVADLMRALAPTIAAALGPDLSALGVGKRDRIDARSGLPLRNEVAAWAGALGIGAFELYVGGRNPHGVFAIATEPVSVVIGSAVTAPLSPAARQAVARELFAIRRGSTIVRHRTPDEVAALVVAACQLGGHALTAPAYAMLAEFQRLLGKAMSRRVRKQLPDLSARVQRSGQGGAEWARAAVASLDRMAAIAAGDVSYVLCETAEQRGQLGASRAAQERARRLLSFVLSPSYLALRDALGMGVR